MLNNKQVFNNHLKQENLKYVHRISPREVEDDNAPSYQVRNPYVLTNNPWYMIGALLAKFLNFKDFTKDTRSNLKFKKKRDKINQKSVVAQTHTLSSVAEAEGITCIKCPKCSNSIDAEPLFKDLENAIYRHLLRPSVISLPAIGKLMNNIGTAAHTGAGNHFHNFLKQNDNGDYYFDNGEVSFPTPSIGDRIPSTKVRFTQTHCPKSLMGTLKEYLFLRYCPISPLLSKKQKLENFRRVKSIILDFLDKSKEEQKEYAAPGFINYFIEVKKFLDSGFLSEENIDTAFQGSLDDFNPVVVQVVRDELESNADSDIGYYFYTEKDPNFSLSIEEEGFDDIMNELAELSALDDEPDADD